MTDETKPPPRIEWLCQSCGEWVSGEFLEHCHWRPAQWRVDRGEPHWTDGCVTTYRRQTYTETRERKCDGEPFHD